MKTEQRRNPTEDIRGNYSDSSTTEDQLTRRFSYAQISRVLSRDFIRVFYVNILTGAYVEYIPHVDDQKLDVERDGEDFFKDIKTYFLSSIYSEDRSKFLALFHRENLLRVLEEDGFFALRFRLLVGKKYIYVRVKGTCAASGDPTSFVVGLSNIDTQMQRLAEYERIEQERLTYAGISEALAADYFCIYYVDAVSGNFEVYNASPEYVSMGLHMKGPDFFGKGTLFAAHIYEKDDEKFHMAFSRENVMSVLLKERSFSYIFRLYFEGRLIYVQMKATRMLAQDDHHIVVGLSNVDTRIRQEREYERALGEAREIVSRDPLTGVKSNHAFKETESDINKKIKAGTLEKLTVMVCDVNGLKAVNDIHGHKAGDAYIMAASRLICYHFKHSPVFRIGGDEFVVIPAGLDYENLEEQLRQINSTVEENRSNGKVVVAIGLAEYCKEDSCFEDVFERADAAMYKRKQQLKNEE